MTQVSRFWDGTTVGDATVAPYDAGTEFSKVLMSLSGAAGVATNLSAVFRAELNELAVTGTATPVSVNTGRAITWGAWYENDVATTVAIPTPAALTRIDRIVLRKDWVAQTVRVTRIAGTEGGAAPALVQSAGTTWDQPLAQVSITTGGVITVTDQRAFIGGAGLPTPSGTNTILVSNGGVASWTNTPTIGGAVTISSGGANITGTVIINISAVTDILTLTNTDNSSLGPRITTLHESASPAANDNMFLVRVQGRDSTAVLTTYGQLACAIGDPINATRSAYWLFTAFAAGSSISIMQLFYTNTFINCNIFAIGPNGATNPAFSINGSVASSVTGLTISSRALAGGLDISVTSSGTNESLRIDAKGSGTISLGVGSTGNIVLIRATQASINLGVGIAPSSNVALHVSSNITSVAGIGHGVLARVVINNATASEFNVVNAGAAITAGIGAVPAVYVYQAAALSSIGAGASATNVYGYYSANQGLTGVTNAYGVYAAGQSGAATLNVAGYFTGSGSATAGHWTLFCSGGDVMLAGAGALATGNTVGFTWLPSCPGAPTGAPTNTLAGAIPTIIDTTNLRIYCRIAGTWRLAQLT